MYKHFFCAKRGCIVFIILQIFCNDFVFVTKNVYQQLTVCCIWCLLFSVLWYDFNLWTNKNVPSSVRISWLLPHLELNFKGIPILDDGRCKNLRISLRYIVSYSPVFSRGIFSHLIHSDQLCTIKTIWWTIRN